MLVRQLFIGKYLRLVKFREAGWNVFPGQVARGNVNNVCVSRCVSVAKFSLR